MEKELLKTKNGRKERAEALKLAVCVLLNWTEEQYGQYVYDCGIEYLNEYLDEDAYSITVLENSRIFWTWWKNHFATRDEMFIDLNRRCPVRSNELRDQLYKHYNEPKMLAACIHPNSVVLNESYAMMMKELIATETQKA